MFESGAILTPSCRGGSNVLRGLDAGATLVSGGGYWAFDETPSAYGWMKFSLGPLWPTGQLNATWIEWVLERGYGRREDGGSRVVITIHGQEYLRALDWSTQKYYRSCSSVSSDALLDRIIDIKNHHPDDNSFVVAQIIAQVILANTLGVDWLDRHLKSDRKSPTFFGRDGGDDRVRSQGMWRLVMLAEMIFNMRLVPGVATSIRRIADGDIEPGFAEMEVGRLLHVSGASYRFVSPKQKKGDDYDLELLVDGKRICAEAKCKIEANPASEKSLIDSLRTARRQMPDHYPGIIFVKVPSSWNDKGTDIDFGYFLKNATDKFFRGTEHVVSVKFHSSTLAETEECYTPTMLLMEFNNPKHRFGGSSDWGIFDKIDPDAWPGNNWVSILKICADGMEKDGG